MSYITRLELFQIFNSNVSKVYNTHYWNLAYLNNLYHINCDIVKGWNTIQKCHFNQLCIRDIILQSQYINIIVENNLIHFYVEDEILIKNEIVEYVDFLLNSKYVLNLVDDKVFHYYCSLDSEIVLQIENSLNLKIEGEEIYFVKPLLLFYSDYFLHKE